MATTKRTSVKKLAKGSQFVQNGIVFTVTTPVSKIKCQDGQIRWLYTFVTDSAYGKEMRDMWHFDHVDMVV